MRNRIVATFIGAAVLVATPFASSATAQDGADVAAFCQARVDVEAAFLTGDKAAITTSIDALKTTAPSEIATDAGVVADLLAKKGENAFENKKFLAAIERTDAFVLESCGFTQVDVVGIDYEFQGVPATIPAGTTAFKFTNDAPKEHHEIIILRRKPGTTQPVDEILSLPEKKAGKLVDFVTAAFADPGDTQVGITELTPGEYVVACFIPVGGKKHGKPHWVKGMVAEFEVTPV